MLAELEHDQPGSLRELEGGDSVDGEVSSSIEGNKGIYIETKKRKNCHSTASD